MMQLPERLRRAIIEELAQADSAALPQAVADLTQRYQYQFAERQTKTYIASAAHRAAYLCARLPATYASVRAALATTREALPEVTFSSLLDLGAGPGTAMWAAAETFGKMEQMTAVERDRDLIELGRRLAEQSEPLARAEWLRLNLSEETNFAPHDLVVASYSIGELAESARSRLVRSAWQATTKTLLLVEPGTPRGFANILTARQELLALGANLVAPCPHSQDCPMAGNDWCHFAARVERSSLHRRVKAGTLGYEDEKFAYLAAARFPIEPPAARVIRRPLKREGHIHLELCAAEGLRRTIVGRKDKAAFRQARKADWGAAWADSDGKHLSEQTL